MDVKPFSCIVLDRIFFLLLIIIRCLSFWLTFCSWFHYHFTNDRYTRYIVNCNVLHSWQQHTKIEEKTGASTIHTCTENIYTALTQTPTHVYNFLRCFALNFFFQNAWVYIKWESKICCVCKMKWCYVPLCHCNLGWRGFIFLFRLFFYRILIRPKWRYFIIKYECWIL